MSVAAILAQPETTGPVVLTAKTLAVSGILLLLGGVLLAFYLTGPKSPVRSTVDFVVTLPLVFPPIATGFFLLLLLGRKGVFGKMLPVDMIFSFTGVVIASVIAGMPLMVKPVEAALRGEVQRLAEVARVLGKNEWQVFWQVLLPNVRRSVLSGWFLAMGRSLGEVGITLMLGGNIIGKTNTLSLEIYNAVFSGEFDRALVLSGIIGLFSLGIFFMLKRLSAL
ncbi:molybdate ABC transporter permease subunit [Oleidesulfovibrio sp.]|uniref:molybdate ABC transporter permease subunit n=1 Tax=Oleidesulfovibrio sp. TaxID=2909707 RepID=UPI003A8B6CFB